MQIGVEILKEMDAADELLQPNVYVLTEKMMMFFKKNDHEQSLVDHNQSWRPNADYWRNQLPGVRSALREEKRFFEFVREDGEFKGAWMFTGKEEYAATLKREHADIATRHDTHNDRITDGEKRWKLDLPMLADVPLLSDN